MSGLVPFSEAERICAHATKLVRLDLLHPVIFTGVAYLPEAEFEYLVQLMSNPPAPQRADNWPAPEPSPLTSGHSLPGQKLGGGLFNLLRRSGGKLKR